MRFLLVVAIIALTVSAQEANGGEKIAAAAKSMVNKYPYSWSGGNDNGPTYGSKMPYSPYCDDRKVVGFDCCGLSKYSVYQGTGHSVCHGVKCQYDNCKKRVPVGERQAGDLLFYARGNDFYHVTIFVGGGQMVEAEGHNGCKGIPMRLTNVRTTNLVSHACRMW